MARNKTTLIAHLIAIPIVLVSTSWGQTQQPQQPPALEQKLQGMQEAAARSERQLHTYQWLESTTLTINGKAMDPKQSICRYAPDGHLTKTPLGAQAPPRTGGGPLMQHIVKKKMEQVKEEMTEIGSLTALYLPLNPAKFQDALHAKRLDFEHDGTHGDSIIINDYAKPGDQLRMTLNSDTLQIQKIAVKTYFEEPKDGLTAEVNFSELADRNVYPSLTSIDAIAKKISITTMDSDFSKPAN